MNERTLCPLEHGETDDGQPRHKESAPGLLLCRQHVTWLERNISSLPDLYDDLELRLHPSSSALHPYTTRNAGGTATVNKKTGEEEVQAFINGEIAELRAVIVSTLASWVVLVAEERGVTTPHTADPHTLAPWLARHVEWIAAQPWADEPAGHFRELSAGAHARAYPSGRRRIEIAPCEEGDCEGTLITVTSRTADLLPEQIWCDTCNRTIPPREWRQLRKRMTGEDSDVILTVAQASDLYGVPVRTLSRWVSDGRLCDLGDDAAKVRATEVEEIMQRMGVLRDSA